MVQQSGDGVARDGEGGGRLDITALKQIRMVTHLERETQQSGWSSMIQHKDSAHQCTCLPELHDEVEEVGGGGVLAGSLAGRGLQEVLNGDPLTEAVVQPLLSCGEVAAQVDLNLVCLCVCVCVHVSMCMKSKNMYKE